MSIQRHRAAARRAWNVLTPMSLSGRWHCPGPASLVRHVEAGALAEAAAGVRRLHPSAGLEAAKVAWRQGAGAAASLLLTRAVALAGTPAATGTQEPTLRPPPPHVDGPLTAVCRPYDWGQEQGSTGP